MAIVGGGGDRRHCDRLPSDKFEEMLFIGRRLLTHRQGPDPKILAWRSNPGLAASDFGGTVIRGYRALGDDRGLCPFGLVSERRCRFPESAALQIPLRIEWEESFILMEQQDRLERIGQRCGIGRTTHVSAPLRWLR